MDLDAIRTGAAAVFAGMSVGGTTVNTYAKQKGSIQVPAVIVERARTVFDSTMGRGADDLILSVILLVSVGFDETAEDMVDAALAGSGASTLKGCVEADKTLGGSCHFARLADAGPTEIIEYAGVQYVGVRCSMEVTA